MMNMNREHVVPGEHGLSTEGLQAVRARLQEVMDAIATVYIGPAATVETLFVVLLARGHVLLEGVPGVAKTTLVKAFAQCLGAAYRRIQFTPDLLPSDITGTYILDVKRNTFELRKGPVFANVVLGDEINRAPAKTQSALLEAMQEGQVTIEGVTEPLGAPFIVLATQNPVEQEGVYQLPEAQLDRFLVKLDMGYPTFEEELRIMRTHDRPVADLSPMLRLEEILAMCEMADQVHVDDELVAYIARVAHFTRAHQQAQLGASPRASIALLRAAKARSLVRGRDYVLPDDIRDLAVSVLAHRILLVPEAEFNGYRSKDLVQQALDTVRYGD
jgi:MoxR-like ATPase